MQIVTLETAAACREHLGLQFEGVPIMCFKGLSNLRVVFMFTFHNNSLAERCLSSLIPLFGFEVCCKHSCR